MKYSNNNIIREDEIKHIETFLKVLEYNKTPKLNIVIDIITINLKGLPKLRKELKAYYLKYNFISNLDEIKKEFSEYKKIYCK